MLISRLGWLACLMLLGLASVGAQEPLTKPLAELPLKTVAFDSPIDNLTIGASGKYLLLHLKQEQKLAALNVATGAIDKTLSITEPEILIAANAEKLFVLLSEQKILQRWNMTSWEREQSQPLQDVEQVNHLATGYAAQGPLLIGTQSERRGSFMLLDPATLKPALLEPAAKGGGRFECEKNGVVVAAANGNVFTTRRLATSPAGVMTLVVRGKNYETFYEHDSAGLLLPSADGERIYTQRGLYNNQAKLQELSQDQTMWMRTFLPSITGSYYLKATRGSDRIGVKPDTAKDQIEFFLSGDARPILTLTGGPLPPLERGGERQTKFYDNHRIMLFPDQNRLAILEDGFSKISLYELNMEQTLEQSGRPYLYVKAQPPRAAEAGKMWEHPLQIKAKAQPAVVTLTDGPEGLSVTPQGKVTWAIPAGVAGYTNAMFTIKDSSGQEIFHTLRIVVGGDETKPLPPGPEKTVVSEPLTAAAPPLSPAKFEGASTTLKLPGVAERMVSGGGGRYLIVHLPQLRKLAVIDVVEVKIVGFVPVDDNQVHFAASANKLIVALNEKLVLSRWSLPGLKRELSVPLESRVNTLALGSSSAGPFLMYTAAEQERHQTNAETGRLLYDLGTLKRLPLVLNEQQRSWISSRQAERIRCSADGSLFLLPGSFGSTLFRILDDQVYIQNQGLGGQHTLAFGYPSADGHHIYSLLGRYNSRMTLLDTKRDFNRFLLPASEGRMYMALSHNPDDRSSTRNADEHELAIYQEGHNLPLLKLPKQKIVPSHDYNFNGGHKAMDMDHMLSLIPSAKVLVKINGPGMDSLDFIRVDPAAPDAAAQDALYVTSIPPLLVKPGQKFEYQVQVHAPKGGLKYRIESGPPGLTVDPKGKVTWTAVAPTEEKAPPTRELGETKSDAMQKDFERPAPRRNPRDQPVFQEQSVVLSITDGAGQEVFHSFALVLGMPKEYRVAREGEPEAQLAVRKPGSGEPVVMGPRGVERPARVDNFKESDLPRNDQPTRKPNAEPATVQKTPARDQIVVAAPFADNIGVKRSWTDAASGRKLDAIFLGLHEDQVKVKLNDGRELTIGLDRLSRDDLLWLLQKPKPPTPAFPATP